MNARDTGKTGKANRSGVTLTVYTSPVLRAALESALAKTRRSITAEVTLALEKHLQELGAWPKDVQTQTTT